MNANFSITKVHFFFYIFFIFVLVLEKINHVVYFLPVTTKLRWFYNLLSGFYYCVNKNNWQQSVVTKFYDVNMRYRQLLHTVSSFAYFSKQYIVSCQILLKHIYLNCLHTQIFLHHTIMLYEYHVIILLDKCVTNHWHSVL